MGGRGASGDPFKTIECYDLRRDRWFQVTEMSTRRRHVGVVSVNGMSLGTQSEFMTTLCLRAIPFEILRGGADCIQKIKRCGRGVFAKKKKN